LGYNDDDVVNGGKNILLVGADLKHVLRTVAGSVDFKGYFRFVLADPNPQVQARNLVLLGILLNEDPEWSPVESFTKCMYSLHLDKKTFYAMKTVMTSILDGSFKSIFDFFLISLYPNFC
jgi:hypothetical protein